jgi:hypothetical protein
MRMQQFLTLAMLMLAVSLRADSLLIQDLGGTFSYVTTSTRISGPGISAPAGMTLAAADLPVGGSPLPGLRFPGGLFVSDTWQLDNFNENYFYFLTGVSILAESFFGSALPCDSVIFGCAPDNTTSLSSEIVWCNSDHSDCVTDYLTLQYVGPEPLSTISGTVFNDLPDYPTHPGIADETVELLSQGRIASTTVTDANGNYSFTGLPPASYEIEDQVPGGVTQTFPQTNPQDISLAQAQNVSGVDFADGYFGTRYIPEPSSIMLLSSVIAALGIGRFRLHSKKT